MPRKPAPGGFVFVPRDLVTDAARAAFGSTSRPLPSAEEQLPRYGAMQLQHLVANAVREVIVTRWGGYRGYTDWFQDRPEGLSSDRIGRIQRGENAMTLADLLYWMSQFPEVRRLVLELLGDEEGLDPRLLPEAPDEPADPTQPAGKHADG